MRRRVIGNMIGQPSGGGEPYTLEHLGNGFDIVANVSDNLTDEILSTTIATPNSGDWLIGALASVRVTLDDMWLRVNTVEPDYLLWDNPADNTQTIIFACPDNASSAFIETTPAIPRHGFGLALYRFHQSSVVPLNYQVAGVFRSTTTYDVDNFDITTTDVASIIDVLFMTNNLNTTISTYPWATQDLWDEDLFTSDYAYIQSGNNVPAGTYALDTIFGSASRVAVTKVALYEPV